MTTALDDWLATWWAPVVVAPFIGSFIGVLILRLPTGERVVLSRSRCPHCSRRLSPRDMVPVLSWLIAGRRCRYCSTSLGLFYPAVELAAIAVALWAAAVVPGGMILWLTCALGWTLLALAVIDWRHLILPDALTLPLLVAGLVFAVCDEGSRLVDHAVGAAAGLTSFLLVAYCYRWLRAREGLGLGDAKLLAAAGAWVTWIGLPGVVVLAAATALAAVLARTVVGHGVELTERIPFGTYLCLGIWLVWLCGPLIVPWSA